MDIILFIKCRLQNYILTFSIEIEKISSIFNLPKLNMFMLINAILAKMEV